MNDDRQLAGAVPLDAQARVVVRRGAVEPFLVRFAVPHSSAPTPRGETTITLTVETHDEH